jgi:hypothetical protein
MIPRGVVGWRWSGTRVSIRDQHPEAQTDALWGVSCQKAVTDHASGTLARRPALDMVTIGHVRRKGYYEVDALQVFTRRERGGVYWYTHGLNTPMVVVWLLSTVTALMFAGDAWFIGPGAVALGELDLGFLFAGVAAAAGLYPLSLKHFPDRPAVLAPEPDFGGVPVQWVFERRATADEVVV